MRFSRFSVQKTIFLWLALTALLEIWVQMGLEDLLRDYCGTWRALRAWDIEYWKKNRWQGDLFWGYLKFAWGKMEYNKRNRRYLKKKMHFEGLIALKRVWGVFQGLLKFSGAQSMLVSEHFEALNLKNKLKITKKLKKWNIHQGRTSSGWGV